MTLYLTAPAPQMALVPGKEGKRDSRPACRMSFLGGGKYSESGSETGGENEDLFCVFMAFLFVALQWIFAEGKSGEKTGFLLVAPDRGFLGNREIEALFGAFKKSYPSALALAGRDYNGIESGYSAYLKRAVDELKEVGVTKIVAIPLFFSPADPIFQKVVPHLPAYASGRAIRWAAPMRESPLTAQILLDRIERLSRNPEEERLVGRWDRGDGREKRALPPRRSGASGRLCKAVPVL